MLRYVQSETGLCRTKGYSSVPHNVAYRCEPCDQALEVAFGWHIPEAKTSDETKAKNRIRTSLCFGTSTVCSIIGCLGQCLQVDIGRGVLFPAQASKNSKPRKNIAKRT